MKKMFVVLAFWSLTISVARAQFEGSFTMVVNSPASEKMKEPIEMKFTVKDNQAIMESSLIPKGGATGKMILNSQDHSTTMLMDNGGKKMGIKMYAHTLRKDSLAPAAKTPGQPVVTRTGKTKIIEGFTCQQILVDDKNTNVEAWVTEEVGVNPFGFMRAISRSTNDFSLDKINDQWMGKSVSLETRITNKQKGDVMVILVKDILKGPVPSALFSTEGYEIMDLSKMEKGMAPR